MRIEIDGKLKGVDEVSFDEWRKLTGEFLTKTSISGMIWDLMCCQRGPDSPSEKPSMTPGEASKAYKGRRDRKFKTVEVIRHASFFGASGGGARRRAGTSVTLPPSSEWDHFDRHVQRAAQILGLEIETEGK